MKKEQLIGLALGVGAIALFAGASFSTVLIGAVIPDDDVHGSWSRWWPRGTR